jgi:DNA-directed RNA polymerase sigma subunit (sigma70/sigma32)
MTKLDQYGLTSEQWEYLIDQWVIGRNGERDRNILRRKLIIGITFDDLAGEFDLSKQRIEQIVYGRFKMLISHIETVRKS